MQDRNAFYLFTSIAPNQSCESVEYQKFCIASWRNAGFEVVSINGRKEAPHVAALGLSIEIVAVAQDQKPLIRDILSCIVETNCQFAGIVNADCALLSYPDLSAKLRETLGGSLILAERIDVDNDFIPQPDLCGGFDGFFFDVAILPSTVDQDFRIGVPWWDYYLPMVVAAHGHRIVNLETPLLTHKLHSTGWSRGEREVVGQTFWRFLNEWRASHQQGFPDLGRGIDDLWSKQVLTVDELGVVGSACLNWLQTRRSTVPHQLLSSSMEPLETLLRSARTSLNLEAQHRSKLALRLFNSEEANTLLKLETESRIAELELRIAEMERSTSWRITKPLRKFRAGIDGLIRKKKSLEQD